MAKCFHVWSWAFNNWSQSYFVGSCSASYWRNILYHNHKLKWWLEWKLKQMKRGNMSWPQTYWVLLQLHPSRLLLIYRDEIASKILWAYESVPFNVIEAIKAIMKANWIQIWFYHSFFTSFFEKICYFWRVYFLLGLKETTDGPRVTWVCLPRNWPKARVL